MTKERLKELIKQEAIIYGVGVYCDVIELKMHSSFYVYFDDEYGSYRLDGFLYPHPLDQLFETREQAEWYCKMWTKRTERFEPPMWEDIEDYYRFNFVLDNKLAAFVVGKGSWITVAVNGGAKKLFEVHRDDVTKENYEKACEIVRDLFVGGAK